MNYESSTDRVFLYGQENNQIWFGFKSNSVFGTDPTMSDVPFTFSDLAIDSNMTTTLSETSTPNQDLHNINEMTSGPSALQS